MSLLAPQRGDIATALLVLALVTTGVVMRRGHAADASPAAEGQRHELDAPLPPDDDRHAGTLDNGVRYFVRANGHPAHRAELRLVVDVGSVMERDEERGLAHAVEHMLFRGTRHFPSRAIPNYLNAIGMRDGEDVNATTGLDETIFKITVPTDRPEVLDTAIAMLADMAHEASFDADEARQESGVVLAEWRSGRTARERLDEVSDSALLAGSPYSTRRTIGDTAVLRRFDLGAMRRFYANWYRPELMAVAAVGDFDLARTEALVTRHFGAIPASDARRTRPPIVALPARAPRALALDDPEAIGTHLSLWFPHPAIVTKDVRGYRAELAADLWRAVLDARLQEAADEPGAPLLGAGAESRSLARPLEAEVVTASVAEGRELPALDLMVEQLRLLARHGPTPRELARQTASMLRRDRASAHLWDQSANIADGYVSEYLTGEPFVDNTTVGELADQLLPTIDIADVRDVARRALADSGTFVLLTGPRRRGAPRVAADTLLARLHGAEGRPLANPRLATDSVVLMPTLPRPGTVSAEHQLPGINTYDWTLGNGMRVILKPTTWARDVVEFRLVGTGGASLASDADYPSAWLSDVVVRTTGLGPLTGRQLSRYLDASSIDLTQTVDDGAVTVSGSASREELETLFQLLRLHFTSTRADTAAFRRYFDRVLAVNGNRGADPADVFEDSVAAITRGHHPRALRASLPFLRRVDLSRSLGFWNARMANGAGFTLVLTGDFSLEQVRPLVTRYLASLPAGVREVPRDDGVRFPAGAVSRVVRAGKGPRAITRIVLGGTLDRTVAADDALSAVREVVELALSERLRESMGGTYGVEVTGVVGLGALPTYTLAVEFEAAPDRIDTLAQAALSELDRLRTTGPSEAEFARLRAASLRDLESEGNSNSRWATELSMHARMGWPPTSVSEHDADTRTLTRQRLREACARLIGTPQRVRVTMYPRQ